MCKQNKKQDDSQSRRKFKTFGLSEPGLMFAGPLNLFANQTGKTDKKGKFKTKVYAVTDESDKLSHYCADNGIRPQIEIIYANQINDAWAN